MTQRQTVAVYASVVIVAVCGLVYELIIGALSSYLFGSSVTYFSITIGLFMSAMGLGSLASRLIRHSVLNWFILLEILLSLVGGCAAAILYGVFATSQLYPWVMGALILLIGGLVGMEIPLLVQLSNATTQKVSIKDALANVLAFDYAGALLGSLLFPLVLLPELGLLRTSFLTGLINLSVAGLNLLTFRPSRPQLPLLGMAVGGCAVVLAAGMAWSGQLTSLFEHQMYNDPIIYSEQTPYQRIIMTRWGEDVRLFLDGNLQFSAKDEYRYHELLVHPAMSLSRSRENVLVLGGGDGLAVREILPYPDVQTITLIDIDPAMTQLAREHPAIRALNENSLADPRVQVVNEDAYKFLENSDGLYEVILIDLPDPNNEALGKLYSQEFYKLALRHLAAGGMLVTQATSPYFARNAYWCIAHTLQATGLQILPYHGYVPSFGDWGFVLATQLPPQPEKFAPGVQTRFLTPQVFAASLVFDADIAEVETVVSSLNNQAITSYYEESLRNWR